LRPQEKIEETLMLGLMQDWPLLCHRIIDHAATYHAERQVISRSIEGPIHTTNYSNLRHRALRVAQRLEKDGIKLGDRVATMAWNTWRHLEAWYGIMGIGAIYHTINPRLFPDQIVWIINHAEDRVMMVDLTFVPLVEKLAPQCPNVTTWIAMTDRAHMPTSTSLPRLLCYEELLAAESDDYEWPDFDENTAAALCYTSGTTGNPKGALFSHRSTVLHAMACCMPDAKNYSAQSVVLPIVPMFHVNAWGIPYSAPMVGAKLVFPGAGLDGKSLYELFESERVETSAGVPTVWIGIITYMKQNKLAFTTFKTTTIGGAACPASMMKTLRDDFGVRVVHGWGMTEMSPVGTIGAPKGRHRDWDPERRMALALKQGRPPYGVEMKAVDAAGTELPRDGVSAGDILVRGPWVARDYFANETWSPLSADGWFPTGDVGTIDEDGYLTITDRSKDVIKSGGEWISSIELENIAVGHPSVLEAAVISVPHPKWDERPLLIVVKRDGEPVTREDLLRFYDGKTAKWWIPDDVLFVEELPHTATGKLSKKALREKFKDYCLPTT
jgi:fatty-acyl-CoA synthase